MLPQCFRLARLSRLCAAAFPALVMLGGAACSGQDAPATGRGVQPTPGPAARPPEAVLPVEAPVATGPDAGKDWAYRQSLDADLDADGEPERLELAADVELGGRGEPLWEDGHRWTVAVVESDSTRTLLFARFVPFGRVEAAVTGLAKAPRVTIYERGPHRRQGWDIRYDGPGRARPVGGVGGTVTPPVTGILE